MKVSPSRSSDPIAGGVGVDPEQHEAYIMAVPTLECPRPIV